MKSRTQIEKDVLEVMLDKPADDFVWVSTLSVLHVLLDIRDLLANPSIQKDFGDARNSLTNKPL